MIASTSKLDAGERSDLVVSVVLVARDEGPALGATLSELSRVLESRFSDYEIVIVANGSTAETLEVVAAAQERLANLQVYELARSIDVDVGYVAGIEQAIGDVVVTLDVSQDPVEPIPEMIDLFRAGRADIVYGLRSDRLNPSGFGFYPLASRFFYRLYRRFSGTDFPVAASTLRLYSRRAVNLFLENRDRFQLFTVAFAGLGLPEATVTYERASRGIPRRVSYGRALARAWTILVLSSSLPLRALQVFSVLGALVNVMYSLYVVVVHLVKRSVAEGWTSMSLQISLMFFILFALLAVLGEYVARVALHAQQRPPYLILRERSSFVLSHSRRLNVLTASEDEPVGERPLRVPARRSHETDDAPS